MKDIEFTVSDIKNLMSEFNRNRLGSMKLTQGGFSLELSASGTLHADPTVTFMPLTAAETVPAPATEQAECGTIVKSPIVGTFYAAPAPDKAPFIKVGSKVKKGDVLFIIESMKLMNEVTSELDGTVKEILVQNGAVLEYGQPVVCIE